MASTELFIFVLCFCIVIDMKAGEADISDVYSQTILTDPVDDILSLNIAINNSRCIKLLNDFGDAASLFTLCAVTQAKPFQFCENCVQEYSNTYFSYRNISGVQNPDLNCKEMLLHSDRIQIVETIFNFVQSLWKSSHCQDCYNTDGSDNYHFVLSNETFHFQKLLSLTDTCFKNFTQGWGLDETIFSEQTLAENSTVCENCKDNYKNLNDFYYTIESKTCMDVIDSMNRTRYIWIKMFHCALPSRDTSILVVVISFIGVLPLFFYLGFKVNGVRQQQKLMKMKRMYDPKRLIATS